MLSEIILKIAAMEYADEEPQAYYPRPSSAGPERCMRQMVYSAMGLAPKPLSGRAVEVFSDGHFHQLLAIDRLRRSTYIIHSEEMGVTIPGVLHWMPDGTRYCKACDGEVKLRDLHGHIDLLFQDMLGVDRLCDVKGLSMYGYDALCSGEIPHDYMCQLAIYLRALQADNPEIREAVLLVKNKNTSALMEYRVAYDPKCDSLTIIDRVIHTGEMETVGIVIPNITGDIIAKFEEVERHRVAKTLPPRQYEMDHWRCSYCSHGRVCWNGWVAEHAQLTTDIALEGDIVDLLKYEREVALHEASAKKEKEGLREKIKDILKESGVREGRAGGYAVAWTVKAGRKFDEGLLPPSVREQCMVDRPNERLSIRKIISEKETQR